MGVGVGVGVGVGDGVGVWVGVGVAVAVDANSYAPMPGVAGRLTPKASTVIPDIAVPAASSADPTASVSFSVFSE